jgi:hypothetical protein
VCQENLMREKREVMCAGTQEVIHRE